MNRFPEAGTSNVLPNAHLQTACPPPGRARNTILEKDSNIFLKLRPRSKFTAIRRLRFLGREKRIPRRAMKEYGSSQNYISQPEHLSYNKRGMPCSEFLHGALLPYASLCFSRQ
ncbi:MAG TPA: hypothetical protein DD422_06155 [Akkermansia sp.]|nr:hypothetical protein [Akkermansia sp.]HBN17615.1 hypothetical protein [Akkermansia sp.]